MPRQVVVKIAAPMILLGGVLLVLGVFAAWNVQTQHQTSAELIAREMHGLLAAEDLHMQIREIRYQINMFLRGRDLQHVEEVNALHRRADELLQGALLLPGAERHQKLFREMEAGYREFFVAFQRITQPLLESVPSAGRGKPRRVELDAETSEELTRLTDDLLTNRVLEPLQEVLKLNEQVVERANEAARETAQTLKIGFLLLGICGAAAGLLLGTAIARAISKSIVQLNVSVRSVAGKLAHRGGPVTVSHYGGLHGLEIEVRQLERDIVQMVERLQQRELELLRSEQLARVGQLAAGLAHELRNPLMPMKMLVQSAIERGDEGGGLRGRSLQIINEEISRLEKSIQSFLDFARPPVLVRAPADLREVLRGTLELVRARAAQQHVQIEPIVPEEAVLVYCDRAQIRQLLLNLLLNALDAQEQGGRIEVELFPRVAPPEHLTRSEAPVAQDVDLFNIHEALRPRTRRPAAPHPPEPWVAIQVRDNGPGIPPELLESVFEPFVTTKETGTGLGLPISLRIAAAHQGELTVVNRPEGGTAFTLKLPCALEGDRPVPAGKACLPSPADGALTGAPL